MQGSRHRLTPCAAALAVALVRSAEATDGLTCPPEPTVMNLAYGDTVTCTRDTDGDSDVFRFAGTAGEVAMIYVAGSSSRPCLELIAPNDARQVACSFGAFDERLDVPLDQTGTWAIQVTGVFNAEYVLTLERVVPPSPNRTGARYGDLVPGVFDVGGDMDLIAFAGSAGDSVTLLSSGGCVELIEPDNTRPHACATRIDAVLGTSGAQSVLVGPGSGSYSVSVQCLVGPCVVRDLTCTGAAECDDGDDCTADACSPADPAADATGCLHPQATCDDGDPCTTDACEPIGGCTHTP
ncbi:MAG TPA: hypothetical protein VKA21_04000, partial [Candidatus Binatia bacterium]|nr:hypothetical protein [Candidatus Binatia bacterium]